MTAWPRPPLGLLVDTIVPARDKPVDLNGPIPWLRIEDFDGKYIESSRSAQGVSSETIRRMNLRVFPAGTVVCSCSCDMGITAIVARPLLTNQTFIGLVPRSSRTSADFLYYSLQAHRPQLNAQATGAIQAYLSRDDFRSLRLPMPDVATQRRIATFLDAETARIDALIEKKRRMIDLLNERWFQSLGTAIGVGADGRRRIAWLPAIPDHWPVLPLRWLVRCLDGKRVPLNAEERSQMQGEIPYWGANGIVDRIDQWIFDEELVLLGEDGAPFFDRSKPVAFVVHERVWINNHIHVLRPVGVRADFLAHYLNVVDYAAFITGTTRDKLTQEAMGSIPVPLPSVGEQIAIERSLGDLRRTHDSLVERVSHQIELLIEHRQALITAAVTGELDLPEAA